MAPRTLCALLCAAMLVLAAATGAHAKYPAPCPTAGSKRVCVIQDGEALTFDNACFAKQAGAKKWTKGPCPAPTALATATAASPAPSPARSPAPSPSPSPSPASPSPSPAPAKGTKAAASPSP